MCTLAHLRSLLVSKTMDQGLSCGRLKDQYDVGLDSHPGLGFLFYDESILCTLAATVAM